MITEYSNQEHAIIHNDWVLKSWSRHRPLWLSTWFQITLSYRMNSNSMEEKIQN